ncbi:MAG TPA: lasso peptide biosynthesis B2 protein [Bryobacteraceae bacterium]|nr:lasso peptide biosynthesis B2 protein [Bryobacteraceae bacterium]
MLRKVYSISLPTRGVADIWLLVEAFLWLALARIATLTIPFRWVIRFLTLRPGEGAAQNPPVPGTDSLAFARRARRALALAGRRTLWRSNCLTKTLAGAGMLRSRRIASLIAVGVDHPVNSPGRRRKAHAWLSSGGVMVTGAPMHRNYRAIVTFAYNPESSGNAPLFGFFSKN